MDQRGEHRFLRDVFRGPQHTLLVLAGDADEEARARYQHLVTHLIGGLGSLVSACLVVIADGAPASAGPITILADPALAAHGRLDAAVDTVYLVRPDGYLAFRGEPPDPEPIEAYLRRLFRGERA